MAGDLGADAVDVHAKAKEVLGFWFDLLMPEQWFRGSASTDEEIRALFGPLRDAVLESGAEGWRDDPETLLAAVILLDQFSRNIHRGTAEAFAADPLAQALTCEALEKGWDLGVPKERRQFLYMPLMHAENPELQALCLSSFEALGDASNFEALGDASNLDYARDHAEVIDRFGRFPTRNAALGRDSTEAEKDYLNQPGVGW
ncbi:DUF924 domain-containing protein [Sphingomonas sp. LB-2]|uniref:DUF924 family protein n=1 Tax=Sphingomonas caeni TaxID=2984949 RepID=UPI00223009BA|nr:DUF924 family protein [Sphingomonas caeni]MCW3848323.1 DUF924 domain-containing protein [Sphingomonas caeni]